MVDLAADLGRVFGDPSGFAHDATYEPAGADAFSLRVMRQAPVGEYGFDDTRISSESVSFLVRRADVAQPASGDRIVCDGQARIVQGVPELDAERLVWTIDTRPA